jgi:hypothetical protein
VSEHIYYSPELDELTVVDQYMRTLEGNSMHYQRIYAKPCDVCGWEQVCVAPICYVYIGEL